MTEDQELEILQAQIDALFDGHVVPGMWTRSEQAQQKYLAALEDKRAAAREYNKAHKEERAEYRRRYHREHPDRVQRQREAAKLRKRLGIKGVGGRPAAVSIFDFSGDIEGR